MLEEELDLAYMVHSEVARMNSLTSCQGKVIIILRF